MNVKKITTGFILIVLTLLISGCSGFMSGYSDYYYNQQNKEELPSFVVPEGEEEDEGHEEGGAEVLPDGTRVLTLFEILLPDGQIDEELFANFSAEEQSTILALLPLSSGKVSDFSTSDFSNKIINISLIDNYAPTMNYKDGTWTPVNDYKYSARGSGYKITEPMSVTSSDITYYMYDGVNPEYELTDAANTSSYGDGLETRANRFMFYEVRGKASVATLYNMLVCVDTYTRLIFPFAYPSAYVTIVGQSNPSDWAGLSKAFYNFDPVGYVDNDDNFIIEKWYTDELAKKNFGYYQKTGLSPYGYTTQIEASKEETFLAAIREKNFTYRDNTGITETVSASKDGRSLSHVKVTADGVDSTVGIYAYAEATSITSATYSIEAGGSLSASLSPDGKELTLSTQDGKVYTAPMLLDTLCAQSFKTREYVSGKSEYLTEHKFSLDGKTLTKTIYKTEYCVNTEINVETHTFTSGSTTNAIFGDKTITIEGNDLLINDEVVGVSNFSDKGPLFVDRVKGRQYTGIGYNYIFSEDGKKVSYTGKGDGHYSINSSYDQHYRAVYDGWGIQLYDNDKTIKWSLTSGIASDVITRADYNDAKLIVPTEVSVTNFKTNDNVSLIVNEDKVERTFTIDLIINEDNLSYASQTTTIPLDIEIDGLLSAHPLTITTEGEGANLSCESEINAGIASLTLMHTGKGTADGSTGSIKLKVNYLYESSLGMYNGLPVYIIVNTKRLYAPDVVSLVNFTETTDNPLVETTVNNGDCHIMINDSIATFSFANFDVPITLTLANVLDSAPLVATVEDNGLSISPVAVVGNIATFTVSHDATRDTECSSIINFAVENEENAGDYSALPSITVKSKRTTDYNSIYAQLLESVGNGFDLENNLEKDGKYYTKVVLPAWAASDTVSLPYSIWRKDDSSKDFIEIADGMYTSSTGIEYEDFDALILRNKPQYKISVRVGTKNYETKILTGNRELTHRELTLLVVDSIRNGVLATHKSKDSTTKSVNGGSLRHQRSYHSWEVSYSHNYSLSNYQPYFATLNGSYKYEADVAGYGKAGGNSIDTVSSSLAHGKAPYTGTINFTSNYGDGSIVFNSININNNTWSNPSWKDGSLKVTIGDTMIEYNKSNFFFGFYMTSDEFVSKILNGAAYTQQ